MISVKLTQEPIHVHLAGQCFDVFLWESEYAIDNSMAVVGLDAETSEPIFKLSTHIADAPPQDGCIWVKNYSENEGIQEQLVEMGILHPTGRVALSDFVTIHECMVVGDGRG